MPLKEDSDIGAKIWLRRLRSRTATAGKTSLQKVNLRFFNLHRDYSRELTYIVGCMRTLLELNSYEPYSSSRKKKCDAHAKLFFCLLNLLVFWSSRSASSMEPKFSSPKLSEDIPPKTFFRKLSTLESIVTGDEGKKPSDKKIIQQKTHKKSKFRCRKRRNWNI